MQYYTNNGETQYIRNYEGVYAKVKYSREIWICGLDLISIGLIRYLQQRDIIVKGVLDEHFHEITEFSDIRILPFEMISGAGEDAVFVITEFREKQRAKYRKQILESFRADCCVDFRNTTEIRIDICGKCNLRCPSCQVANYKGEAIDYNCRGTMPTELFGRILDKLGEEIADIPAIYLFTLGDPLLHPQVSDIVRQVHEKGYMAVLSSNLSMKPDLERLVESEPDILKISVSGFSQEIYGTTHVGGSIELVKENMRRLHELIEDKGKKIIVMVGYHIYNNNAGEELRQLEKLCSEYGFLFQPVKASYFNMLKRTGYYEFNEDDKCFIRSYYENAEDIMFENRTPQCSEEEAENLKCRNMTDKLFIDYDGTVMLCELFHKDGFFKNYLDTTLEEIQCWRREHWICKRCRQYDMHLK